MSLDTYRVRYLGREYTVRTLREAAGIQPHFAKSILFRKLRVRMARRAMNLRAAFPGDFHFENLLHEWSLSPHTVMRMRTRTMLYGDGHEVDSQVYSLIPEDIALAVVRSLHARGEVKALHYTSYLGYTSTFLPIRMSNVYHVLSHFNLGSRFPCAMSQTMHDVRVKLCEAYAMDLCGFKPLDTKSAYSGGLDAVGLLGDEKLYADAACSHVYWDSPMEPPPADYFYLE